MTITIAKDSVRASNASPSGASAAGQFFGRPRGGVEHSETAVGERMAEREGRSDRSSKTPYNP